MPHLALMNLGMWEIFGILAIALLVFGGKKLPELARSMGSSMNQFKRGLREEQDRIEESDEGQDAP